MDSGDSRHAGDFLCAAAVGALGLFGNSIIQLIVSKVLAERAGLQILLPRLWACKYGIYFPEVTSLQLIDADDAYALPLVADRVVLSHAGWRSWALRHPTGRQLAATLRPRPPVSSELTHATAPGQSSGAAGCLSDAKARAGVTCSVEAASGSEQHASGGDGGDKSGSGHSDRNYCGSGSVGGSELPATSGNQSTGTPAALSGRQLRAHFPQVCGKDLTADPDQLRERLRGRGLWGWFQFPVSCYKAHEAAVRQLLTLRPDLHEELLGALSVVLAAYPPRAARPGGGAGPGCGVCKGRADQDGSGGAGCVGMEPTAAGQLAERMAARQVDAACPDDRVPGNGGGCESEGSNPGHRSAGADGGGDDPTCGRSCCRRRRLVVLHLRRGDFRDLLGGEDAASGRDGAGPQEVVLRDSPPFEDDGQQGQAWRDRSGVDFRVPVAWYGAALAALPYDPDRDLLWVCSDDPELAAGARVCGLHGTSWAAELQRAGGGSRTCSNSSGGGSGDGSCDGSCGVERNEADAVGRLRSVGHSRHGGDESQGQDAYRCCSSPPASHSNSTEEKAQRERDASEDVCCAGDAVGGSCGGSDTALPSGADCPAGGGQSVPEGGSAARGGGERLRTLRQEVPQAGKEHQQPRNQHHVLGSPSIQPPQTPPVRQPSPPPPHLSVLSPEQCRLLTQHPLLADWWVMQRADLLLTSNSTFSFTAAMLNDVAGAVLMRPDPAVGGLRRFDPWDELPLLPSAEVSGNHSLKLRGKQG